MEAKEADSRLMPSTLRAKNDPHHERAQQRQSAEYQTFAQSPCGRLKRSYFKTCEKHEVEDAYLAENLGSLRRELAS